VDIVPYSGCDIILDDIKLEMLDGTVESLNELHGVTMPVKCLPLDNVTFLYRLSPTEPADLSVKTHLRTLDILIRSTAAVSEDCKAPIITTWKASIDFTIPVNPGYGQPSQNLQRTRRPANLSIDSFDASNQNGLVRPDLPSVDPTHKRTSSIPDFGITITFTSPNYSTPGQIFTWTAFVVNRSMKPRKLALIVLPKPRRGARSNRPPSMGPARSSEEIADAFVDEIIIHALQRNAVVDAAELVCLSTDLRVGPLAPAACHSVDIRMLTLGMGVVGVEAVRVVDLGSNEHVDVHDLPTIVSVGKELIDEEGLANG